MFIYRLLKIHTMKKIYQIEPSLGIEEKAELVDVINSGWFTEAKKTKEFERKFADFTNCKYACTVTSGTAGLYLGLLAMELKKNDEVIVPDLTFVASPNAIQAVGAKPILCDIEKETLNLDLEKLEKKITRKTKAIMIVNFNGRTTNMKQLKDISKKYNLKLIEDAAHSLGSYYKNSHQGTNSDLGVFSFSTPKIITTGQGGMIITNKKNIYEKCCELKDFGRKIGAKKNVRSAFDHKIIGYNFKFTEFQAGIGISQMKKLPKLIVKKKKMFQKYEESFKNIKQIEFIKTDLKTITPWMADIILDSKSVKIKLMNYLEKNGVETRIFYPPIHRLDPYKQKDGKFKISSDISDRGLWLPSSNNLTKKQLEYICKKIQSFFN